MISFSIAFLASFGPTQDVALDLPLQDNLVREVNRTSAQVEAGQRQVSDWLTNPRREGLLNQALVDERDDHTWVRGRGYRASFGAEGVSFVPMFGRAAPRDFPVDFRLEQVTAGETVVELRAPLRSGDSAHAVLDHGSVREVYHLGVESIEQTFVFDAQPGVGDLVVSMEVTTELEAEFVDHELRFQHPDLGHVSYGEAFAYDVTGWTIPVARHWEEGRLRLTVPADFVSQAAYPLTIDPPLSGFSNGASGPDDSLPDICYDARSDVYWVVWQEFSSASNGDCVLTSFDAAGVQGASYPVEIGADDWREPRVAFHFGGDRVLVVGNVAVGGAGGSGAVQGRLLNSIGNFWAGAPFTISTGTGTTPKRYADVAGNSWTATVDTHFLVVWSNETTPGNHSAQYRVVRWNGALFASVFTLPSLGLNDVQTSVSQSIGDVNLPTDYWMMTWIRDSDGDGLGQVWARRVLYNGFSLAGGGSFVVDPSDDCAWPSITSRMDEPTLVNGDRPNVVAYHRELPSGSGVQGSIFAAVVTEGEVLHVQNITAMEDVHPDVDQVRASVATDGVNVLLSYQERYWATPGQANYDMYMVSGSIGDGPAMPYLGLGERHQPLAVGGQSEGLGRMTSRFDGGDLISDDGAVVWQIEPDGIAGSFVDAATDEGDDRRAAGSQFCMANAHSGSSPLSNEVSSWATVRSDQSLSSLTSVLCVDVPVNQFGYLLASTQTADINMPGGSMGRLCLADPGRYTSAVQTSGPSGTFATSVDPLSIPQPSGTVAAQPGESWFFQYWHRDLVGGQPTSNFSNGVEVIFLP